MQPLEANELASLWRGFVDQSWRTYVPGASQIEFAMAVEGTGVPERASNHSAHSGHQEPSLREATL